LAYQELDPKYTTAHTDYSVQIKSELQRQAAALSGLTPEQLSSAAVLRYRELHGKYLDYAYGLWAGGFLKEAARMLYGAQGLRAQFEGFPVSDLQSPLFEKPDIPFTPLTKDYYNTVSKRSAEYLLMNDKVRSKSRWFEAAAIVTRVNGLGMLDAIDFTHGYGFSATADFLRETNEALFTIYMLNAIKIDAGTLDETFTTPKGEVISFKNLSGKELDYALVKFEQTKVEEFLIKHLKAHSFLDAGLNAATINLFMRAPWLPDEVKRALFESFNFARYEDRVRLGQRIIDELYKKP
jgi:hypothetical protein